MRRSPTPCSPSGFATICVGSFAMSDMDAPAQRRKRFVYDIETNGLLDTMDKIHCLVMYDLDTKELLSFRNDGHPDNLKRLEDGVRMLNEADKRIGHNIIGFDERALKLLYPWFDSNAKGKVLDTLILCRLIHPNIGASDKMRVKRKQLEGRLIGSHSLEAWGQRIGEWKGDYSQVLKAQLMSEGMDRAEAGLAVWAEWSEDMQVYCDQDVTSNLKLYRRLQATGYSPRAVKDEMDIAVLCAKMEDNGYPFAEAKAGRLYATLAGARENLGNQLKDTFGSWVVGLPMKTPKSPNSSLGYWGEHSYVEVRFGEDDNPVHLPPEAFTPKGNVRKKYLDDNGIEKRFNGYPYSPIKIIEFNPTSRHHIANRLTTLYGWKPKECTPNGDPKIDEDVMAALPYDCGPLLTQYFTVSKRIGQLAEGKQAWLKHIKNGKVHGRYNPVGAVTRRATHSSPNIGQVPSVGADYGEECRELFGVPTGWVQVGTDASGLELRCLAHYMARWDDGAYGKVILEGDIHTVNQEAAGLPSRDNAKTFIYAFLYGAGDGKIGSIIGGSSAAGKLLRSTFMTQLPALGNLVNAVKRKAQTHKHLLALDGGMLHVRSAHSALNTLLQSAGALICKKWGVIMEEELIRRGYKHGWDGDFVFMAWIHDEYQIAARTQEIANVVAEVARWAIKQVEEYYEFRMPLDCDSKFGINWRECH